MIDTGLLSMYGVGTVEVNATTKLGVALGSFTFHWQGPHPAHRRRSGPAGIGIGIRIYTRK